MIPALRHILGTHAFLSRRHGWKTPLDEILVQGCLREARTLATSEQDEPAALFFAFCKAWARLGEACAVLPDLLARNHARSVGLELDAPPDDQRTLRLRIAVNGVAYSEVREWFAARLAPIERGSSPSP